MDDSSDSDARAKAGVISKTSKLLKMNLKDLLDRTATEKGAFDPVYTSNQMSVLLEEVVTIMQY
jgi:hypothetical protein